MKIIGNLRKRNREGAQGIVEFALVLPILLLVIVGIMEMGRLLFFYSSVVSASREGARYASAAGMVGNEPRYADCEGIENAALKAGSFAGLDENDIAIIYDNGITMTTASCPPSTGINLADRVVVTASGSFSPVIPLISVFFPEDGLEVSSVTARTIIKDVGIEGTPHPTNTPAPTPTPVCPPSSAAATTENKTLKISIPNPDIDYVYYLKEIDINSPDDSQRLETITFTSSYTDSLTLLPSEKKEYHIEPAYNKGETYIWYGRFDDPGIMEFTFDKSFVSNSKYIVEILFSQCELVTSEYIVP